MKFKIAVPLLTAAALFFLPVNAFTSDLTEPIVSMEFVYVNGGEFSQGDETGEGRGNEKPPHKVKVTDFYMAKYEVTVDQFARFTSETGYLTAPEQNGWVLDIDPAMKAFVRKEGISWKNPGFKSGGDHPVTWVDWNDAMAFAAWLSRKTGRNYELPTEAQWEYAAKAGKGHRWAGTSTAQKVSQYAWHSLNSRGAAHQTGSREPNALGIYDMSGNVWEWCLDGYQLYHHTLNVLEDPVVVSGTTRTIRGGSWRVDVPLVSTTYRNGYKPDFLMQRADVFRHSKKVIKEIRIHNSPLTEP